MRRFTYYLKAGAHIIPADRFRIVDGALVFYENREAFLAIAPGQWIWVEEDTVEDPLS